MSTFTKGDIAVGIMTVFLTGAMVGMWLKPEPRFSVCTEIKPMPEPKPMTQAQKIRHAKWMMRDRGVILK